MKTYILFALILLSMYSCKKPEIFSVDKNKKKINVWIERDTSEYEILKYKKGALNGECIYLNQDGIIVGNFKKGKKDGEWKYYIGQHLYRIDKYKKDSLIYSRIFNPSNIW